MKLVSAILFLGSACITTNADCNVDEHHPDNGGYFIEGVAGFTKETDPESPHGAVFVNSTWGPGIVYPYGQEFSCEGRYCSCPGAKDKGTCPRTVAGHTCSFLRFCPGDSGVSGSIYLMPDFEATESCDFRKAKLVGQTLVGPPDSCYDYVFEEDHEMKTYYFADKQGCSDGQKVGVSIMDFDMTATQCEVIGLGTPRIQKCDCNLETKGSTLSEPCRSAFVNSCLENSPGDKKCCETNSCVARDKDYSDPIGKKKEKERRKRCNDDIPGLCYNEDGSGTPTNRQGSQNCCDYVCSECGIDLNPLALWKPCTSSDYPANNTASCGYLSRYDPPSQPTICDFSKCDDRDHWKVNGKAYQNWVNP